MSHALRDPLASLTFLVWKKEELTSAVGTNDMSCHWHKHIVPCVFRAAALIFSSSVKLKNSHEEERVTLSETLLIIKRFGEVLSM